MKVDPVLHQLLRELRQGHFRPRAVRRFVTQGIGHAIDLAWSLKSLRRSFYIASAVMAAVLGVIGLILAAVLPDGVRPITWVATALLFVWVFAMTLLQLGLVRAENSGELYEKFTFPNVLTLLRLLVVPYMADTVTDVLGSRDPGTAAQAVFALVLFASLTDMMDGWLSRRLRQTSEFGRIYDPVVDIVFHTAMAVTLFAGGAVTEAYLAIVLLRYLLPPVAGFFLFLVREPFRVKSTFMGKASSLVLSVFLCAVVFSRAYDVVRPGWAREITHNWLEPLAILVCAATVVAFVARGMRILRGDDLRRRA